MLHPMQAFIRYEDAVQYEEMLAWRVRLDGTSSTRCTTLRRT
jgi:hypothetical protein